MSNIHPISHAAPAPRRAALAVALLVALALLVACGNEGATATATATAPPEPATAPSAATAAPETADASFPLTLSGSDGVAITIPAQPQRIVSVSPGATEILFAIGAGPQVVAVDRYSDYPPAAQALPQLATYLDTADPETVLAQSPDLLVTSTADQAQQFRSLGIPTLLLDIPTTIDGVYEDTRLLGTATGHDAETQRFIAETRRRVDAVVQRLRDVAQGPTVFFELDNTLYTAAPGSFIGNMLALLHARNVAAGASSPFPQLTAEAVIAANPEVILLADGGFGESLATVAARPGWSTTSAVTTGRVIAVDPNLTNRPGARIADAVELLAGALYPDRFAAAAAATATPAGTAGAAR